MKEKKTCYEFINDRKPGDDLGLNHTMLDRTRFTICDVTGTIRASRVYELPNKSGAHLQEFFFNPDNMNETIEALRNLADISLGQTRKMAEESKR